MLLVISLLCRDGDVLAMRQEIATLKSSLKVMFFLWFALLSDAAMVTHCVLLAAMTESRFWTFDRMHVSL